MQEYAARVCSDGRVQTVKEHTVGVWEKAESDAALMGVASIAKLVCLLHDMGKNTAYSNEYQHTDIFRWNRRVLPWSCFFQSLQKR